MTLIADLSNEVVDLFKSQAIVVNEGFTYYHLPQWFKDLGNGRFEIIDEEDLPEEAKETLEAFKEIKKQRDKISSIDKGLMPEIRKH